MKKLLLLSALFIATISAHAQLAGGALNFDGNNDYVSITDAPALRLTNNFTIECWFNAQASNGRLIDKSQFSPAAGYALILENGRLKFYNDSVTVTGNTTLNLNQWYHVAVVFEYGKAAGCKIYLNGNVDGQFTPNGRGIANTYPLTLGYVASAGAFTPPHFNGTMEEVRIWSRVLCQGEIQNNRNCELTGSETGLVAYYKFNQGLAGVGNILVTSLTDNTGHGYTGSLQNFGLSLLLGNSSNWVAGFISNSCTPFVTPTATATAGSATTFCLGGSVTLTASLGDGYQWYKNGSEIPGATLRTLSVNTSGSYTVKVTTLGNCDAVSAAINVTVNPLPVVSLDKTSAIVCPGQSFSVCASGTPGTTYTWAPSMGLNTATGACVTATPTSNGVYNVTATDANGCKSTATVNANLYSVPFVSTSASNILCYGDSIGSIEASVSGGLSPYTYSWSNGSTDQAIYQLKTGTYSVTVTDAHGCSRVTTDSVTSPEKLTLSGTVTDISCNGNYDGSIFLTTTGGIPDYYYYWGSGANDQNPQGLPAGDYFVTVYDNVGCSTDASFTIHEPTVLTGTATVSPEANVLGQAPHTVFLGYGPQFVTASASADGGSGPYTYHWSPADGVTNVDSATTTIFPTYTTQYTVTMTDAHGCIHEESVMVYVSDVRDEEGKIKLCHHTEEVDSTLFLDSSEVAPYLLLGDVLGECFSIYGTVSNLNCYAENYGSIDITVTGGAPPYSYEWSNGSFDEDQSGLSAVSYSVTVTDANGWQVSRTFDLTQPDEIQPTIVSNDVTCFGGNGGSISVEVTGGVPGYTYSWNDSINTKDLTGLTAGTYTLTVTDSIGCQVITDVEILQPDAITGPAVTTRPSCFGYNDGSLDVTVSGGTAPYALSWDNNTTAEDRNNITAGTYVLNITDAYNCHVSETYVVGQPALLTANAAISGVSCFGDVNGSINLQPAGGTTPYSYLWYDNSTDEDRNSLAPGTYMVAVTDSNGCLAMNTFNVTEPDQLSATATAVNVSCNGNHDGSIHIAVSGGTAPYTYSWNNNATAQNISGLAPGTYSVDITDAHNCTTSATATIAQPDVLTVSGDAGNVSCYGLTDGSITLTLNGGTAPYSYQWNDNSTAKDRANIGAGNYSVTVTDANGCTATQTFTIASPGQIVVSGVTNNVTCFGGNNGAIIVSVAAGTAPYTYQWENNSTAQNRANLIAGIYTVTVTDDNGCNQAASFTITQPTLINIAGVKTNASCNGGGDGSIDITTTGGTAPYTYSWGSGITTEDRTGLAAGTYTVTVTDANGCVNSRSFSISQPTVIAATTTVSNVSCNGGNNGSINLTVTGGTPGYTYNWSNNTHAEDPAGLVAGTYNVTVIDSKGCTASASATVGQPAVLSVSGTATGTSCFGGNNGSITITAAGGTAPYTYKWNNNSTTQNRNNLIAGNYSVTVTDAHNCTATASFTVSQPAQIIVAGVKTNTSCFGGSNGTIDITATGGTAPYTYSWGSGVTSEDRSGLTAGTYNVTVTDSKGCIGTAAFSIAQPTQIAASITPANVTCNGANNGVAHLTVTGGTPGYTYLWNNNATTQDINNLVPGTYNVTVTDANSCTATASTTITQPVVLAVTGVATNVSCFNGANGAVNITATGGTAPYTYKWENASTTEDRSGLTAGNYNVIVTDAHGCTATASFTITQPTQLVVTGTQTNISCNGGNNGSITLNVTGGTAPYTYKWENNSTAKDRTNLTAGAYVVVVTDANGCNVTSSFNLNQPTQIAVTGTKTDVNCFGSNDGTVTLNVGGGVAPYTYNWNNGFASTKDLTGLNGDIYSVIVTDVNGCSTSATFVVEQPLPMILTAVATNVKCFGTASGSIDVTVTGGTLPYVYLWNNGGNAEDRTNLAPGVYTVTVTDAHGCVKTATRTITQPAAGISVSGVVTNVSCNNGNNGAINITATGGTAPYTYSWNGGVTSEDRSGLASGAYTVTVTDANGCNTTTSYTVTQPSALALTASSANVNCNGGNNGSVDITVTGGTSPYSYNWGGGITSEDRSGLTAGTYNVTITDANGCNISGTYTITEPSVLALTAASNNVSCKNGNNGAVDITVTGGTTPYTYNWGGGISTEDRSGLVAGAYSVTITDAHGCSVSGSYTITEPTLLTLSGAASNVNCNGGNNGTVSIAVAGGTTPYSYNWGGGVTSQNRTGLSAGTYGVTVTDANGCAVTGSWTVNQPSTLTLTAATANVNCNGGNNGAVNITVGGGTAPYIYNWGGGITSEDLSGLSAGTYNVTVTDANGCTITGSYTITQPAMLAIAANTTNVSCNTGSNGSITLSVAGGTAPYSYNWGGGITSQNRSNLSAGTYYVTVTDANGCTATGSYTITQPAVLSLAASTTNVNCSGLNGAINITVTGGTTPYSYNWGGGVTTEDRAGLTAGIYTVTVTDANGCTIAGSWTLVQPVAVAVAGVTTNVSCNGGNNGAINITATGGTSPYTYNWGGGVTVEDRSALTAGTYGVTVMDANGCTTSGSYTVTQPAVLAVTAATANVSCNGSNNGAINITVTGGTAPYTYNWGGGVATEDRAGLTAGTYGVTITDANGCVTTGSYTINQPAVLAIGSTSANVSCNGGNNGAITLTVTGGTSPYTYNWGGGITSQNRTGLTAGTYNVTVTDSKGCSATGSWTISQPVALAIAAATTNVSCNGGNNGAVYITVSGGTAPYTYNWGAGVVTEDRNNLGAGTYSVTVTDANGCSATGSWSIAQPAALTVSAATTNATTYGGNNGAINITAAGGTAPYTYSWGGGVNVEDRTGLIAGTYNVTVTDANGCATTGSWTITQPANNPINVTASITNITCNGGSNGAITLTVSGGTAPYTYLWNNNSTSKNRINLTAGTYTVTVRDAANNTRTVSFTVAEPAAIAIIAATTDVSCSGDDDGALDITVAGGTAPYTYSWNDNNTSYYYSSNHGHYCHSWWGGWCNNHYYNNSCSNHSQDMSGLEAGTYTVTVTDANGCTKTASFTIAEPTRLTVAGVKTNVTCYGSASGAINITAAGGTAPYTYKWNNNSTVEDRSGLTAGTYSVTVTDANGCTATGSWSISQPSSALNTSISKTNVSCYGSNTGAINLSVSGGSSPYSYSWNNNATTQDLNNLSAGTYNVTVTDANGCTATNSAVVTQPASAVVITGVKTNVSCNGDDDGSVDVTVTGGTAPYSYNWDDDGNNNNNYCGRHSRSRHNCWGNWCNNHNYNNSNHNNSHAQDMNGLEAGTYTVTVTDANGCTQTASFTITEPTLLTVTGVKTNVTCYGSNNGTISLTAAGGTAPYSYKWNNNSTVQNRTGLTAGTYSVTVTDAHGCTATGSWTISQPSSALSTSIAKTNVSCYGSNTGAVNLSVSGGTSPYSYNWSNNATTQDLANVTAGTYNVTVTDASGCTATNSAAISQPASAVGVTAVVTNITCYGSSTGAINITATGGTAPYSYKWNNNSTSEDRSALTAGTYSVTVTDGNGCTANGSWTVTQPASGIAASIAVNPNPTVSGQATNTIFKGYGQQYVTLTGSATGGSGGYAYSWYPTTGLSNPTSATTTATPTATTTYTLTVTDGSGCSRSTQVTIRVKDVRDGNKIVICHNGHAQSVASSAVPAHLAHGDYLGDCDDDGNCGNKNTGGITVVKELKLYPNPSSGVFYVELPEAIKGGEAIVMDMNGKVVERKMFMPDSKLSFDLSYVAKGVYMVEIVNGNDKYKAKINIQ